MIHITDKHNCCGCSACKQICPKQCITMQEDEEGFLYPKVNTVYCIRCGLCEQVCSFINPYDKQIPKNTFGAINKEENVRFKSSSGGVFSVLANSIILKGGVVFGTRFDEKWNAIIDYTDNQDGISLYMGSKYVQAQVGESYKRCKDFLQSGKFVLFSGTPCQITGLKHYLNKEYDKLLTIDVACHGVPSPKVWNFYIRQLENVINDYHLLFDKLNSLNFELFYLKTDKTIHCKSKRYENDYSKSFIYSLTLRPSCYNCKAKDFRSRSDITIADFWGIKEIIPTLDDDKGTSLVFINTIKGKEYLDSNKIFYQEVDYNKTCSHNPALIYSSPEPIIRNLIFDNLNNNNIIENLRNAMNELEVVPTNFFSASLRFLSSIKKHIYKKNQVIHVDNDNFIKVKSKKHFQEIIDNQQLSIADIQFRDKYYGWKKYGLDIILTLN